MMVSRKNHSMDYMNMQTSKKYNSSDKAPDMYYQHNSAPESGTESHFTPKSSEHVYSDNRPQLSGITSQTIETQYCTLESSSASGGYTVSNSSSRLSFSSNSGSPTSQQDCQSDNTYGSPVSGSCLTEDPNDLKHKLKELETEMFADIADSLEGTFRNQVMLEPQKWKQVIEIPRDLKQLLVACANAVAGNDFFMVEWLIEELRKMVSVSGEPIERLGAYLLEGLVARLASSGSSIYKALKCKEPASSDLLSYMHILYEVCPYFKFGYMSANGAIVEAVKGEQMVHVIDFQIAQGSQWVTLIQALAARPGGPPSIRLTGIDDSVNAHARGGGLHLVGQGLSKLAASCNVPFEFQAVAASGSDVELEHFGVRTGEALAVNFAFQLHHVPDESVNTRNHRDRILRMVKSLSPKVVTLVEQESNTNTAPFVPRFLETLDFYTAVFESIDVTLPRENKERISVEQHCLARDIVNIIACEGAERVERHELLGKWRSRLTMAGFTPYPLSTLVNDTIKALLESYCEHYRLEERDGALYLGWKNRALVVSSAWR